MILLIFSLMTMAGRSRSSRRQRAAQQAATTDAFANAFVPPTAAAPAAAANAQDTVINLRPHDDDYGVCDCGVSRLQHDNGDGFSSALFAASGSLRR